MTDPAAAPWTILQERLSVYFCPSNNNTNPISNRGNQGHSSYIALMGNHASASQTTTGNGVFFRGSEIRIADMNDGTSNTAMIGERASGKVGSVTYVSGVWPGNHGGWASTMRNIDSSGTTHIFFGSDTFGFSSYHPGGLNVLLGDASVHFMSDTVTPAVQGYLAQRNDGVPFELP